MEQCAQAVHMFLLSLFWSISNNFQIVNPLKCMFFTGWPCETLFVAIGELKMLDSKSNYRNSSPKCHEDWEITSYFYVKKEKKKKKLEKKVGNTPKTLLFGITLYEGL